MAFLRLPTPISLTEVHLKPLMCTRRKFAECSMQNETLNKDIGILSGPYKFPH